MIRKMSQRKKYGHIGPRKGENADSTKVIPNWKQRVKAGLLLASSFLFVIYQGSLALSATILLVQFMCYKEILTIGYTINNNPRLPKFRMTVWYFFIVWNYTLIGESLGEQFRTVLHKNLLLSVIFDHSRFKGFCLYFAGIVLFVLSLAGKYDIKRFRLLAIVHVILVVITLPTYLLMKCSLEGMVWAVVPLSSVCLNDIFAYVFGKLMGKTPLILVSPNKTWEGFIGGVVGTIFSTIALSSVLCNFKHFICPTEYNEISEVIGINTNCTPSFPFEPNEYNLVPGLSLKFMPFVLDSFYIALFASFIAPFAGFFASGFKRAFNMKDFSNTIPGHGGIIDRFDCQFLMAIFIYVYMSTFLKTSKFKKLYGRVMNLNDRDQLVFYDLLKSFLEEKHLL
ncbi:phosphatidate cytidylyltransferase, photoreceptor-specific-like isoform X2 [Coccinella septempunctata]|uniref:phosphatidate cytidylyltransferase, photoreceptor-specific-like isoform X2 n=1 Tax=Coccinella septempunctata TaxID=41139 RepID=UPI001D096CAE|nr:phosphatidate cytidylyltransferase, photoreceptor-specific-like isoform X2 [Coccinella septempunctata]